MLQTRSFVKKSLNEKVMPLLSGPLLVIVHFKIPSPLSLPERKRLLQNGRPHIKKPDGDNLEKFLNDALQGIIWEDDSRIAWLVRSKTITNAKEGETTIFVREIENDTPNYELLLSDIMEHINLGGQDVA